jgi:hypothetical protein
MQRSAWLSVLDPSGPDLCAQLPRQKPVNSEQCEVVMSFKPVCFGMPKGLAFDIPDLILANSWAELNDFRMVVRLDHGAEDEEYEEILAFHNDISLCNMIMWRNMDAVFVQPLVGKRQRYSSVAEALGSVVPKQPVVLTDISATTWPTG